MPSVTVPADAVNHSLFALLTATGLFTSGVGVPPRLWNVVYEADPTNTDVVKVGYQTEGLASGTYDLRILPGDVVPEPGSGSIPIDSGNRSVRNDSGAPQILDISFNVR